MKRGRREAEEHSLRREDGGTVDSDVRVGKWVMMLIYQIKMKVLNPFARPRIRNPTI
jgi:hypothetical protein